MCCCPCFAWWVVLILNDAIVWLWCLLSLVTLVPVPEEARSQPKNERVNFSPAVIIPLQVLNLLFILSGIFLYYGTKARSARQFGWGLVIRVVLQTIVFLPLVTLFSIYAVFAPCEGDCKYAEAIYFIIFIFFAVVAGSVYASFRVHERYVLLRDGDGRIQFGQQNQIYAEASGSKFDPQSGFGSGFSPSTQPQPWANPLEEVVSASTSP